MKTRAFAFAVSCLAVTAATSLSCSQQTASEQTGSVHVLSSNGIRAVVEQMLPQAEAAAGRPIEIEWGTSAALRTRIADGEAFDVVLATAPSLDAFVADGDVVPATRKDLALSGLGVGVREGTPWPDIGTPEAMKQTLLDAASVTYARDGASRQFIEQMAETFGISSELEAKTILEDGSTGANAAVRAGTAQIVLTLASEIISEEGVDYVGQLPAAVQNFVTISGGISPDAENSEAGEAFLEFLASPAIEPALTANGMQRP